VEDRAGLTARSPSRGNHQQPDTPRHRTSANRRNKHLAVAEGARTGYRGAWTECDPRVRTSRRRLRRRVRNGRPIRKENTVEASQMRQTGGRESPNTLDTCCASFQASLTAGQVYGAWQCSARQWRGDLTQRLLTTWTSRVHGAKFLSATVLERDGTRPYGKCAIVPGQHQRVEYAGSPPGDENFRAGYRACQVPSED